MITSSRLNELDSLQNVSYKLDIVAIDDNFVSPSEICDIYEYAGLSVGELIKYFMNGQNK